jgi:hypothetical protein
MTTDATWRPRFFTWIRRMRQDSSPVTLSYRRIVYSEQLAGIRTSVRPDAGFHCGTIFAAGLVNQFHGNRASCPVSAPSTSAAPK